MIHMLKYTYFKELMFKDGNVDLGKARISNNLKT